MGFVTGASSAALAAFQYIETEYSHLKKFIDPG